MKKKILITLLLFTFFNAFSQINKEKIKLKEISFSKFLREMTNDSDTIFNLKNTYVKFDKKEDERYNTYQYRFENKSYPSDTIDITKVINFENVHFQKPIGVRYFALINFRFHKPVIVSDSYDLSLFNCQFLNEFRFRNFPNQNKIKDNSLYINDCSFSSKFDIVVQGLNRQSNVVISNSTFDYFGVEDYSDIFNNPLLRIDISDASLFNFDKNIINYDVATFSFQIYDTKVVYFSKNVMQSKFWNYLSIENIQNLVFIDSNIKTDLIFGIDKMKSEYDFQWPLSNGNIIPSNYFFSNYQSLGEINNKSLTSIYKNRRVTDLSFYKSELTQLSKFHSYFKEFHDRQSANDVYNNIKDLETDRLEYLYNEEKSFKNYFEMIVNKFLKKFSDYGTSPSKIVLSSFNIILIFAFLFLFSSNSWNNQNITKYSQGIEKSIDYFTSDSSIIKAFNINQNRIIENNNTKISLNINKNKIPKVFSFLSTSVINAQNSLLKIKLFLWNKINLVKNSWYELSSFRKMTYSIILTIVIVGFIFLKILSILLNSLTLSINSFTTLGFGEIPIKGIGRYLAIIEGFIGWIFLTLFSVTLISQILS